MSHCNPTSTALRIAAWSTLAASLIVSATHAADELANTDVDTAAGIEFFEKHVRPILVEHCYECHSSDEASGGLLLDSRAGLVAGGDTGTAFVAGKPNDSLLIDAVRYNNENL